MPKEKPLHPRTDSEIFAAAAAAVARGDDLDDCLAELLGLAAERLGAVSGAAYILDADRDQLELAVTFGVEAEVEADAGSIKAVTESHDPLASSIRSRRPLEVDDAGRVAVLRGAATAYVLPLDRAPRRDRSRAGRHGHRVCGAASGRAAAGGRPSRWRISRP